METFFEHPRYVVGHIAGRRSHHWRVQADGWPSGTGAIHEQRHRRRGPAVGFHMLYGAGRISAADYGSREEIRLQSGNGVQQVPGELDQVRCW